MKKLIVALVILVAAGGGAWYWKSQTPTASAGQQTTTARVERGTIVIVVQSTGRVVSNLDVDVRCKAGGQVTTMPYDVSDEVKKGDLLVELDPVDELRKVKQAEVSVAASQARLQTAKENLALAEQALVTDTAKAKLALTASESRAADARAKADRVKQLLDKKLASQEEYESAETVAVTAGADLEASRVKLEELKTQQRALEVKRQDVKLAQAVADGDAINLEIANDRLRDCKVISPMDGVVSKRSVQVGQIIASATSNVGGGTSLLTLSDLSRLFVVAAVDESEIGKVREDQPARITADAYPGKFFAGKVVQIATAGVNVSNVVTFEVKIEVTSENKALLKPEMTANVTVTAERKEDVLLAPVEAVVRKAGKHVAEVDNGRGKQERPVEVGLNDGTKLEIVNGLNEGDIVVFSKDAESRWSGGQRQQGPRGPMMLPGGPPRGGR